MKRLSGQIALVVWLLATALLIGGGADEALRDSFVVTYFLESVYRVTPDGQTALIFRAAEPQG